MLIERDGDDFVSRWWLSLDKTILSLAAALLGVGFIMVFATSPYADQVRRYAKFREYLAFLALGVSAMLGASMMGRKAIKRCAAVAAPIAFAALAATLFARARHGAQRWVFGFQPSEFVKPLAAILFAWGFERMENVNGKARARIGASMAVCAVAVCAILWRQPDVGMMFTFLVIPAAGLFFWVKRPLLWSLGLASLAAILLAAAIALKPHAMRRSLDFQSDDRTSQVSKCLDAVSDSGFLFSHESSLKNRIGKEVHNDFVFCAMVEELGSLISEAIVGLYILLVAVALSRLKGRRDRFRVCAVGSLAGYLGFQVVVNVATALKLLPAKGMALPFVSSGGSSLVSSCAAVGLILALLRKGGAK